MDQLEADNTILILNRSTKKKTTMERIGNRCNYFHEKYYSKALTDPIFSDKFTGCAPVQMNDNHEFNTFLLFQ